MAEKDEFSEFGGSSVQDDPFSEFGGTVTEAEKKNGGQESSMPSKQVTQPSSTNYGYNWSDTKPSQEVIATSETTVQPTVALTPSKQAYELAASNAAQASKKLSAADKDFKTAKQDLDALNDITYLKTNYPQLANSDFVNIEQIADMDERTGKYVPKDAFQDVNGQIVAKYNEKQLKDFDRRIKGIQNASLETSGKSFEELQGIAEQKANNYQQNLSQVQQADKELKNNLSTLKELNSLSLTKYGITESFFEGVSQTANAVKIAGKAASLDDEELANELEGIYVAQTVASERPEGLKYTAAEMIGSQVAPMTVTIGAGLATGGVGGAAMAAATYGTMGYGQNLMQGYMQARSQGMTPDEAVETAKAFAKSGAATGAAEGIIGYLNPFMRSGTLANKTLLKGVKTALTDGGLDATVAMGMQVANNQYGQGLGLEIGDLDGVLEQGAGELAFSLGMNAMFGAARLKPEIHKALVYGLAQSDIGSIKMAVDAAVKEGVIDAARAGKTMDEILSAKKAFDVMPDNLPEETKIDVVPQMERKNQLEKELEEKDESFAPAIEAEMEEIDRDIREKIGAELTDKELKEYDRLKAGGTEEKPLTRNEKKKLKHYEKRIKRAEKLQADAKDTTRSDIADEEPAVEETVTEQAATEPAIPKTEPVAEVTETISEPINTDNAKTKETEANQGLLEDSNTVQPETQEPTVAITEGDVSEITPEERQRILDARRWSKMEFNIKRGEKLTTEEYVKLRATKLPPIKSDAAQTQKSYQQIAGLQPNNQTGRIPVEPIIGGKPKNLRNIMLDVSKGAKQRLFYSKPGGRRGALGTYSPGNSAVKIRFNGDLDVTAHELGHSIDDMFGVVSDLRTTPNPAVEAELAKFSPFGSKPPAGHPDPATYERAEGFAEWLRAYMVNPSAAIADAPELYNLYEAKVHDDYKQALDNFSTDVRTWAGASGRDMTLANIEFEPEKAKGVIKKLFDNSDNSNQFSITWADKVAANFINPTRAFNKAFEYAKGIKGVTDVLPQDNPEILSRLLLGVDGKYGEILEHGMVDAKTNDVLKDANGNPKNLKWLLEPLDNTDMSTIKEDMKDVVAYMVSERTVELADKFGRENVLSGIGGGVFKDVDVAQKTLNEFRNGDPQRLARIQEAAARYRDLSDDILRYMVDKGRMSIEQYTDIKANNLQYVAMQRVLETEPDREISAMFGKGGNLGSVSTPVRTIKGSTKEISNPYSSLIDTLYKAVREADRNDVMRSFRDMITEDRGMYDGAPKRFADIGVIGKEGDKNTTTIFVDGKPEHWIFQEDIHEALKGLDKEPYKIPAVITAFPRALRWTVTNFPVFAARNFVRDIQDRLIKTEDNSGVTDLFGNKEHWRDLARSGGLNSGYYTRDKQSYYGLLEQVMDDLAKDKRFILADPIRLKEGWQGYKNILTKSETANRVAEYRAAYKKAKADGMDDYNATLYAGYKSRDLMDFALMGHYMKVVNQLIPFSNAAVQALRKSAVSATNNPTGFAVRMLLFSIAPDIALWLWNHRNEEAAKQYENLPAHQRDMAWNLQIGDNKWISLPKPYELSLISAGIDRMMSKAAGYNDRAFDGYAGSAAKSLLPVDEGNIAGPFQTEVEIATNYDFFREKNIVPPYENPLDISLRNTENASRFGKAVQEVAGIDARKTDHWIKQHFSYYGKTGLKLTDIGRDRNQFGIEDLGFFKQTPAYNSPQVQELMNYAAKWGLTQKSQFKRFRALASGYFNAKTDADKEVKAKALIEYSKGALEQMKKMNKKDDEGTTSFKGLPTLN